MKKPKPETIQELTEKQQELLLLLIECRDAICAIPKVSARLRGISLSLADRIDAALKPWEIEL